jgi:uracil DNA glycosylase
MLLESLLSTINGVAWANLLSSECIEMLGTIERQLDKLTHEGRDYSPDKHLILEPFHRIHPDNVRLVMICKEPYTGRGMATGIPIETKSGFMTPSSSIFKRVVLSNWNLSPSAVDYMSVLYNNGILVINASFTAEKCLDKRYELSTSHFTMWCKFTYPLMNIFADRGYPICSVGVEAKQLDRAIKTKHPIYRVSFPHDGVSIAEFEAKTKELFKLYGNIQSDTSSILT